MEQDQITERPTEQYEENALITERRKKLAALRQQGNAYPNTWRRNRLAQDLQTQYQEATAEELEQQHISVAVAGRVMARRIMGKASFAKLRDMSGDIQLFLQKNTLAEVYEAFENWDLGDIVGASGILFRTKTGELSIKVEQLHLLTKNLRPLPDKFHGISNIEQRYRQRYVDLFMNMDVRDAFKKRQQTITYIRNFLNQKGFMEVETPMMHPIPGGATAAPFITHHNALDMPLYLRVAPELYLKRLVVGGFEQVYEINRNFRNEGVSARHNPEFTMLEFYWAYADYLQLIELTEEMLSGLAREFTNGNTQITYQGEQIDFKAPFSKMTVMQSIAHFVESVTETELQTLEQVRAVADRLEVHYEPTDGWGKVLMAIFDEKVEHQLRQPTFITEYPLEVSPLARRSEKNPEVTDRFEMFIGGRELANGFSELNDPEDQAERFREQVRQKDAGDAEAMHYDADYIRAMEYGLPPTAGEGIGIDRLVMLFTDSASIRDVILFPHLRLEQMEGA